MKKTFKNRSPRKQLVLAAALAGMAVMSAGCGKQAYVVTNSQAAQQAPGSFSVPPKIDILLVQDDTGSSIPIFTNISSQLDTFATNLQSQGWDYHLATIPLTTYRPISQVQASVYDPNWGAQWQAPYPGAMTSQIETVSAGAFRFPDNYTDFLNGGDLSPSLDGTEPGFANLKTMLMDSTMTSTGFLRKDAVLAIVLLSTGDDTSGRNYCSGAYAASDDTAGMGAACDLIPIARNGTNPSLVCGTSGANPSPYCNNYQASLQPYANFLVSLKGGGNSSQVRFYPVVSAEHQVTGENCGATNGPGTGTNAFMGQRYQDILSSPYNVNGQSFDICTIPIPTVLTNIASNLSAVQLNFYTSYLFMAQQPNPSTIVVYRNPGGDTSQAVEIPQDPNNGWSYAGDVTNVYTTAIGSASATPTLNLGSGYAVQLHGTGILGGADTATVQFTPAGIQNSAAQ